MRNFKNFFDNKIAVTFSNEQELIDFLKLCQKFKMRWSDCRAIDYKIPIKGNAISYGFSGDKKLGYADVDFYKDNSCEIVSAKVFLE